MVQETWMDEDVHAVQHHCQRCLFYSRLNGMVTAHYKSVSSQLWFTRVPEESDFCSDSHYGRFFPTFPQIYAIRGQDFWIYLSWRPLVISFFKLSRLIYYLKIWYFLSALLSEERLLTVSFLLLLILPLSFMRRHHERRKEAIFTHASVRLGKQTGSVPDAVHKAVRRGQTSPVKEEKRALWCFWLPSALSATDTLTLKHSVSFSFSLILPLIRSSQPSVCFSPFHPF